VQKKKKKEKGKNIRMWMLQSSISSKRCVQWGCFSHTTLQLKATNAAQSLRIKLDEIGAASSCTVKDLHSAFEHRSVKRFHLIFKEQLLNFQQYTTELKKKESYAFKHTGNADEMVLYFGMHQNYNVDVQGAGEVKIISTGYEKQHVMVMLCITTGSLINYHLLLF
jgi:hypothetical protein